MIKTSIAKQPYILVIFQGVRTPCPPLNPPMQFTVWVGGGGGIKKATTDTFKLNCCCKNTEVIITFVMLNILCTTLLPNFILFNPQHSTSLYFRSEWKSVWILVRWLHQKPADLDLQCYKFQKRINPVPQDKS